MSGQVLLADVGVGIVVVTVLVVALEGAFVTSGTVVALGSVAIVYGKEKASSNAAGDGVEPVKGSEVDFGPVAVEIGVVEEINGDEVSVLGELVGGQGTEGFLKRAVLGGDVDFLQLVVILLNNMDGEGVDKLVGEETARNRC